MSDFEFLFALFGLLLGLTLTEVLGGFARAIEAVIRPSGKARIGWLTPLLGLFVILDLLSFWRAAWTMRSFVTVSGIWILALTVFAGAYYLAAHLVFPRETDETVDFDAHFCKVRRIVIGVLLALLVVQLGWYATIPAMAPRLVEPLPLLMTAILVMLMIAAMSVRGERWSRFVMLALVGRYLVVYLL